MKPQVGMIVYWETIWCRPADLYAVIEEIGPSAIGASLNNVRQKVLTPSISHSNWQYGSTIHCGDDFPVYRGGCTVRLLAEHEVPDHVYVLLAKKALLGDDDD
jgi:hypothetical protein